MPTAGSVKTQTMFSLFKLIKGAKFKIFMSFRESSLIHRNREGLAQEIVDASCTHLMFIDSDMVFEEDAVDRLLERNKDIIGVNYYKRQLPKESTVKIHDEHGKKLFTPNEDMFE